MFSKDYFGGEHEALLVSKLWHELENESDFADIEVTHGEASAFVHSCVLLACCPHLKSSLIEASTRCQNLSRLKIDIESSVDHTNKSNQFLNRISQFKGIKISTENLKNVLKCLYFGKITLTQENIYQVEYLALLLDVDILLDYCTQFKAESTYQDKLQSKNASSTKHSKVVVLVSSTPLKSVETSKCSNETVTAVKAHTLNKNIVQVKDEASCEHTDIENSSCVDKHPNDLSSHLSSSDENCNSKRRKTGTFNCPLCVRSFKQHVDLSKHLLTHKNDSSATFQCTYCDKILYDPVTLRRHMASHTKKKFQCDLCDKRYTSEMGLKVHKKSSHRQVRNYTCAECGKSFSQKAHLQEHGRVHTQEKQHVCSFCGAGLCSKVNLRRHERSHTGERPFRCIPCDKSFAVQQDLDRHNNLLHKKCDLTCEVCGITVQSRHCMNLHSRMHSSERLYQCQFCSMRFSHAMWLRRHEEQHEVERNQMLQTPASLMAYNSSIIPLPTLNDITLHRAYTEFS